MTARVAMAIGLLVALGTTAAAQEAPAPGGAVQADRLSKVPRLIKPVEAEYPAAAAAQGLEAEVILLLDIDEHGRVTSASVATPSAHPGLGFEEAALVAAQQLEFEPAELDGKPLAVQISYRTRFRFTPRAPAAPAAGATAPAPPPRPRLRNLTGQLRERGTRLPLPGVLVTVFRDDGAPARGFEFESDAEGRFHFFDLEPGDWKLLAEPPGYFPLRTQESVRAGEATEVTYYLERGSYNPFDVNVVAPRARKEVSRTVIAAQEIDRVPGAAGDPLAVVQNFAGVNRGMGSNGAASGIMVRGSAPEDTRIFVDGTEVPYIFHFGGLRSALPVTMLEGIDFHPGNFSSAYGRATGGVIDTQTRTGQPQKLGGAVDVSLLDAALTLDVPLGRRASVTLGGRHSYLGAVMKAAVPDDADVRMTSAPRYYDYQVLVQARPAAAHQLRAMFFASNDKLELLFASPADVLDPNLAGNSVSSSEKFWRAIASYRYVPGGRFENFLRVTHGRDNEFDRFGQLVIDVQTDTTQLRDDARLRLTPWMTLAGGVDVLMKQDSGFVRAPPVPKEGQPTVGPGVFDLSKLMSTAIDERDLHPAAYLELELRPFERWLLLPGVRVDHLGGVDQTLVQPRLTSRLDLASNFTVKGGAGLYSQQPSIDELLAPFGNPELRAERASHFSFGAELRALPHLSLDLTGFYKRLSQLTSRTDAVVPDPAGGPARRLQFDNGGRGRVYGAELTVRHEPFAGFSGWLAYTLSRSLRTDGAGTVERLFDFDQTHILTAVASYAFGRNWQLGGRFRLVSGNPRTPVVGASFNNSIDAYDPIYGPVNSDRHAPFHQLDLRLDKRWVYQSWMLNLYLEVQNVYDRKNPEGVSYSFDFRESKAQAGLPILPILGLKAEF